MRRALLPPALALLLVRTIAHAGGDSASPGPAPAPSIAPSAPAPSASSTSTSFIDYTTKDWCRDPATKCWAQTDWFPGVRLSPSVSFGIVVPLGQASVSGLETSLGLVPQLALEVGAYVPWWTLQLGAFGPMKVPIDNAETQYLLANPRATQLSVSYGGFIGATLLGCVAAGFGAFHLAQSQFVGTKTDLGIGFLYAGLDAVGCTRMIGSAASTEK